MVAHVMDTPYVQFQRYPMMLITAELAIFVFEKVFLKTKTPENQMLVGVAYILVSLISFVYLCMYLSALVSVVSKILKVDLLTIKPKAQEKEKVSKLNSQHNNFRRMRKNPNKKLINNFSFNKY